MVVDRASRSFRHLAAPRITSEPVCFFLLLSSMRGFVRVRDSISPDLSDEQDRQTCPRHAFLSYRDLEFSSHCPSYVRVFALHLFIFRNLL